MQIYKKNWAGQEPILLFPAYSSDCPTCLEHAALRWVAPDELASLDWAAADALCHPIVADFINS